ncbi:hypothetical protein APHCRT_0618 [Anaplasma phagocytophilum str. CRT53-1]|uniref:Uncharacterized protein n=2 Tax=Anaplasma phagocytophilum TaxID=948 RepID=A0A0F3PWL2_ANAPH|nr:hypothetical protein APHWEB_1531 [Anaplasma phagocytophilum str. Webster]KJV83151.1 hypothetical protein APHHGE2_0780 [Anaplasma phagocytophilum str. HGE2]KJV84648.1 hypothetical protein APHWI1_1560 [Anaplasma phagocytophilum str. ApWI1]KJV86049.1 hypothetical protein APHCRT_0618 [Anaplasma phagocytophilum str. CRT53-1]KJV98919.1 hypothetical protein OTSANNIE_0749 [Anaplasma phagocytophilum str. Annie]KKA00917.1 hypothetical protein APHCR_1538 [Anaplasma phagocytophilum str. CR1007]
MQYLEKFCLDDVLRKLCLNLHLPNLHSGILGVSLGSGSARGDNVFFA